MEEKICTCKVRSDTGLEGWVSVAHDYINGMAHKYAPLSDKRIVNALGDLEGTDHKRTCGWYGFFLEACELKLVTR